MYCAVEKNLKAQMQNSLYHVIQDSKVSNQTVSLKIREYEEVQFRNKMLKIRRKWNTILFQSPRNRKTRESTNEKWPFYLQTVGRQTTSSTFGKPETRSKSSRISTYPDSPWKNTSVTIVTSLPIQVSDWDMHRSSTLSLFQYWLLTNWKAQDLL